MIQSLAVVEVHGQHNVIHHFETDDVRRVRLALTEYAILQELTASNWRRLGNTELAVQYDAESKATTALIERLKGVQ